MYLLKSLKSTGRVKYYWKLRYPANKMIYWFYLYGIYFVCKLQNLHTKLIETIQDFTLCVKLYWYE